jgi:hypothetical protein
VSNQALLLSLNPMCLLKSALGSQLTSGESIVWIGKGFGEPSRPNGWSKPKAKVVYRQKSTLGLGLG